MIAINRLDQITFCALVLWLNGSYSTSTIINVLRTTEGTVKAACREKAHGGFLPKPRKFMTRGERQEILDYLKHNRLDGGLFSRGDFFVAQKIKDEPEEPVEMPDPKTKAGKRRLRELAYEAQVVRNKELREEAEKSRGYAARGVETDPLNWLDRERLLRDPEDVSAKKAERFSSEMRRHECGLRFRRILEDAELSGFKEVSLERAGQGGSAGTSIPERFITAVSASDALRKMMGDVIYIQAVAVIHHDEFIWDDVPTKVGRDFVMEDIRRALDTVALFIGMMESKAFEERWGEVPEIGKSKSRDESRDVVRAARAIIQEGMRQ